MIMCSFSSSPSIRMRYLDELHLTSFYEPSPRPPAPTLLAAARTCRSFLAPALKVVWFEATLTSLLRVLPVIVRREGVYVSTSFRLSGRLIQVSGRHSKMSFSKNISIGLISTHAISVNCILRMRLYRP